MKLLYLECKTGKFTYKDISKTIERGLALHSVASVMFLEKGFKAVDIGQRLKHIQHPILISSNRFERFRVKDVNNSDIYRWLDCYFIPANYSVGDIELKLQTTLRLISAGIAAQRRSTRLDSREYDAMGYQCDSIPF